MIFDYQNICFRAGSFECSCRIVFAVGAREYGYENSRLSYAPWSLVDLPCAANEIFYFSACSRRRREYLFQRTLKCHSRIVHFELLSAQVGCIRAVEHGDFLYVKSVKVADVVGKYHKVAKRRSIHIRRYIVPSRAKLIAHTSLEYACYHAALFNDVASLYFALCHSFTHSLIELQRLIKIRNSIFILWYGDAVYILCSHVFRKGICDDLARLAYAHCKRYQRRRYVNILKAAAHTVLAAYCADAETYLRIQRAKQCRKRLSPSVFILIELLKELLQRQSHSIYAYAASNLL